MGDDELKKIYEINLLDYLAGEGWREDHKKGSGKGHDRKHKMRGPSGEILWVYQGYKTSDWLYWNPLDPNDKGTIVDFLQRRHGGKTVFTIGHVKRLLRGASVSCRSPTVPPEPLPVVANAAEDPVDVAKMWEEARAVWGLPYYLKNRGLTAETVAAFASSLRMDRYENVLFGHTDDQGQVVGYEIKGPNFTGFAKGGLRTLWRGGPLDAGDPVKIALTESGVDALSLAQITGRRDTLYCSTGGGVGETTLDAINALAARFSASEMLLCFDADLAGDGFTATVQDALQGRQGVRRIVPKAKDWNEQLKPTGAKPLALG